MLREASRKWRSDDSKAMNWSYDKKADVYTDDDGVFKWHNYSHRTDKNGMTRDFKVYRAEAKDENIQDVPAAYTNGDKIRQISINPSWEYQKARMREILCDETNASIYARRKNENDPVYGRMKERVGAGRFMVRGLRNVKI